ncbi:hypothetical protein [Nocardia harenae]|uniref:hypothetical protein n=1 Tax=Nocardia harenae TaxID=358707 RepID=UPI0012EE62FC|nr:hypothetical protein [Nocardia harenae]
MRRREPGGARHAVRLRREERSGGDGIERRFEVTLTAKQLARLDPPPVGAQ